jgi:DNA repair protein RecO (recombination protein O)
VRKTKSRFGGRVEPASNVSLLVYEGRELDVISQAETIERFPTIRKDLESLTDAMALLEAVEGLAQEQVDSKALYKMLVGALRRLSAGRAPLLVPAFYWKLLALEGAHPVLDRCAGCGGPLLEGQTVAFDPGEGGTLCRACRKGRPMSAAALGLIRRTLGGDLAGVLAEPLGPVSTEVSQHATDALEFHLERRLRVVHMGEHLPEVLRGG